MSTKRTRHAISMLGVIAGGSGVMRQAIQDALAEVEAIERAAKAMQGDDVTYSLRHGSDEVMDARAILRSIAKDAP